MSLLRRCQWEKHWMILWKRVFSQINHKRAAVSSTKGSGKTASLQRWEKCARQTQLHRWGAFIEEETFHRRKTVSKTGFQIIPDERRWAGRINKGGAPVRCQVDFKLLLLKVSLDLTFPRDRFMLSWVYSSRTSVTDESLQSWYHWWLSTGNQCSIRLYCLSSYFWLNSVETGARFVCHPYLFM